MGAGCSSSLNERIVALEEKKVEFEEEITRLRKENGELALASAAAVVASSPRHALSEPSPAKGETTDGSTSVPPRMMVTRAAGPGGVEFAFERAKILADVSAFECPAGSSQLVVYGPDAFVIAAAHASLPDGTLLPVPAVAAAIRGHGRVVALCHLDMLSPTGLSVLNTDRFAAHCIQWAAGREQTRMLVWCVGIPDAHRKALQALRLFDVLDATLTHEPPNPRLCQVVLVAGGWEGFNPGNLRALEIYAQAGGGVVVAYDRNAAQYSSGRRSVHGRVYPGNVFLAPMGMVFNDEVVTLVPSSAGSTPAHTTQLPVVAGDARSLYLAHSDHEAAHVGHALDKLSSLLEQRDACEDSEDEHDRLPPTKEDRARRAALGFPREVINRVDYAAVYLPLDQQVFPERLCQEVWKRVGKVAPQLQRPITKKRIIERLAVIVEGFRSANTPTSKQPPSAAFGAESFPGKVPATARFVSRDVPIDSSIPGWHSTGLYAPPGVILTATVTATQVPLDDLDLHIRVGCHSDVLYHLDEWKRYPAVCSATPLNGVVGIPVYLYTQYGGLIYIDVRGGGSAFRSEAFGDLLTRRPPTPESSYYSYSDEGSDDPSEFDLRPPHETPMPRPASALASSRAPSRASASVSTRPTSAASRRPPRYPLADSAGGRRSRKQSLKRSKKGSRKGQSNGRRSQKGRQTPRPSSAASTSTRPGTTRNAHGFSGSRVLPPRPKHFNTGRSHQDGVSDDGDRMVAADPREEGGDRSVSRMGATSQNSTRSASRASRRMREREFDSWRGTRPGETPTMRTRSRRRRRKKEQFGKSILDEGGAGGPRASNIVHYDVDEAEETGGLAAGVSTATLRSRSTVSPDERGLSGSGRRVEQTMVTVFVDGCVTAPYFVHGRHSLKEWELLRQNPAPWGELASSKIVLSLPSTILSTLDRPDEVMEFWDRVMDCYAVLSQRALQSRPERLVVDMQLKAGNMHNGYPIMLAVDSIAMDCVDLPTLNQKGVWSVFRTMGFNFQKKAWTVSGMEDVTVNLFTLFIYDTMLGIPPLRHPRVAEREGAVMAFLREANRPRDAAPIWRGDPMAGLHMYIQLLIEFGWELFFDVFAGYQRLAPNRQPVSDIERRDQWFIRLCQASRRNLGRFFQRWGINVSSGAWEEVSLLPTWLPPYINDS